MAEKKPSIISRVKTSIKRNNEKGARAGLLEDLFYDFNRSRAQVYKMNFIRGIFFGLGSVLGGTVLIAVGAMILSLFVDLPGGIGDFVQRVVDAMKQKQ